MPDCPSCKSVYFGLMGRLDLSVPGQAGSSSEDATGMAPKVILIVTYFPSKISRDKFHTYPLSLQSCLDICNLPDSGRHVITPLGQASYTGQFFLERLSQRTPHYCNLQCNKMLRSELQGKYNYPQLFATL